MDVRQLRSNIDNAIINPLIALLFAAALVLFAWGIVEFLWGVSSGSESKETGKQHMLWGIIGMVIMTSAYAIINIVLHTFGVGLPN